MNKEQIWMIFKTGQSFLISVTVRKQGVLDRNYQQYNVYWVIDCPRWLIDAYRIFQQFQPSLFSWSAIKTKDAQLKTFISKTKHQVLSVSCINPNRFKSFNQQLLLKSNRNSQLLQLTIPRTKKNNPFERNCNHWCYYKNPTYDNNMTLKTTCKFINEVNKRPSQKSPKVLTK